MAKKKTKETNVCCAPLGDYKPRLYLSVEGQDVSQLKELEVGEEVTFKVTGKVVGLSQRERPNDSGKGTRKSGDIDLEDYRVSLIGEEDETEFETMAKDEEDDK